MIGEPHFAKALEVLNNRADAIDAIADAFGMAEAGPHVRDLMGHAGIDPAALGELGKMQREHWIEQGVPLEEAQERTNAYVGGVLIGVIATYASIQAGEE